MKNQRISKLMLRVKLTLSLILLVNIAAIAGTVDQSKVTLSVKEVSLEQVLQNISNTTSWHLIYQTDEIRNVKKAISINVKNVTIQTVLDECLKNTGLKYVIEDNTIIISTIKVKPVTTSIPITITGKVITSSGEPLVNASVAVKGTPQGTITDFEGKYTLEISSTIKSLFFSYMGMRNQEVTINGHIQIDVVMVEEVSQLNETVVIGYGTSSRKDLTSSISSINSEDIARQPVANPLIALQGMVSGVVITQANGLPGSTVNILIRGKNSMGTGTGTVPLYIIDGVPFNIIDQNVTPSNNLNTYGISAANKGISPFSMINPSDVERIDILKDADATAIYGTRAANGVVLITTKKAKAGKTRFDLNFYQGIGTVSRFLDVMNLKQYLALRRQALKNDGLTATASNAPDLVVWDTTKANDWQKKYIGGTAHTTDAQATVSGGDARTRFLLAAGYHKETTVFPGDWGNERISSRFNVEHNSLDKKFYASISTIFSLDNTNLTTTDLSSTYSLPPNLPLYKTDGSLYWDNNFTNPESYLMQKYVGKINNLSSNITLRYTILPGLDFKVSIGYNKISMDQNQQTPISAQNPSTSPTNQANFATMDQQAYILEPQAVYTTTISKGKLTALAGTEWQQSLNKTQYITATGYSNPELMGTLAGASSYSVSNVYQTLYRYNSVFGRLTYDWNNKYIINGSIRVDGSSRFGPGHRWGTFGSIGAAWIFTNEKFIADALPFLSFGKLRVSYGNTGNDQFADYKFLSTLKAGATQYFYQGNSILSPSLLANPDLHWETNKKTEIAVDLSFLEERVMLTVNAYRNRCSDQILSGTVATQTGFLNYTLNMAALLQNQGLEFELNTNNISTKNFTWRSSVNFTIPQNKLLSFDPNMAIASIYESGQSLTRAQRYVYVKADSLTGKPLYLTLTGTLTNSPALTDRIVVGNTDPKFYGGFNNTLTYKGFDLSFFFQFRKQSGNMFPSLMYPGALGFGGGNQLSYWLNRWQTVGDDGLPPKASTSTTAIMNYTNSTAGWGDVSFIKLKNMSLSYTVPSKLIQKTKISNLKVYMMGQNLLTWTKNKYSFDPETGVSMPQLRTITLGINCSF